MKVYVNKDFLFNDGKSVTLYKSGYQDLPKSVVTHWFAKEFVVVMDDTKKGKPPKGGEDESQQNSTDTSRL